MDIPTPLFGVFRQHPLPDLETRSPLSSNLPSIQPIVPRSRPCVLLLSFRRYLVFTTTREQPFVRAAHSRCSPEHQDQRSTHHSQPASEAHTPSPYPPEASTSSSSLPETLRVGPHRPQPSTRDASHEQHQPPPRQRTRKPPPDIIIIISTSSQVPSRVEVAVLVPAMSLE